MSPSYSDAKQVLWCIRLIASEKKFVPVYIPKCVLFIWVWCISMKTTLAYFYSLKNISLSFAEAS
jgi:hypothetical protein